MNKVKKVVSSPFFAIGAFALAAVLLLSAGIGGASAALNDTSGLYQLNIDTKNIGVQVIENGEAAVDEKLALVSVPEVYQLGTEYPEVLTVKNSNAVKDENRIDEYVRVVVYQYWTDAKGDKLTEADTALSPDLIQLNFVTDNGWSIDSETPERTILSYSTAIGPDESTTPFVDSISIDPALADELTETTKTTVTNDNGTIVTNTITTYAFNGGDVNFNVEVEAEGVQTHNAEQAMMSSWGYVPENVVIAED